MRTKEEIKEMVEMLTPETKYLEYTIRDLAMLAYEDADITVAFPKLLELIGCQERIYDIDIVEVFSSAAMRGVDISIAIEKILSLGIIPDFNLVEPEGINDNVLMAMHYALKNEKTREKTIGIIMDVMVNGNDGARFCAWKAVCKAIEKGCMINAEKIETTLRKMVKIETEKGREEYGIRLAAMYYRSTIGRIRGKRARVFGVLSNGKPKPPVDKPKIVRVRGLAR